MQHDGRLIAEYIDKGSDAAFAKLLDRHLPMVYSVCLRELHDPDAAHDAAQVTFMVLAGKASGLRRAESVAGWLFSAARNVARTQRRQEECRMRYEAASAVGDHNYDSEGEQSALVEHLNDALSTLRPAELDLIKLRFFDELSLAEIGRTLGVSEDSARMRVTRLLERLRRRYRQIGVSASLVAVATVLDEHALHAAPSSLHLIVMSSVGSAGASAAPCSASVAHLLERSLTKMKYSYWKLVAGGAVCLLIGIGGAVAIVHGDASGGTSAAAAGAPSHNAFDYFVQAEGQEQDQDLVDANMGQGAPAAQQLQALSANAQALATVRQGCRYPYQSPPFPRDSAPAYFKQFRALARLLGFESRIKTVHQDYDGAMQADIDAIQLGTDIQHTQPLIGTLVGFACETVGRTGVFDLADRVTPAAAKLDARRLARIDGTATTITQVLTGEEQYSITGQSPTPPEIIAAYRQYMDAVVVQTAKPFPQRSMVPLSSTAGDYALSPDVLYKFELRDANNQVQNEMLSVALALSAYHGDHGAYPATLTDLMPDYLDQIPLDPFTAGQPLLYHLQDDKYVLYSIGPDGADNGGRPISQLNDKGIPSVETDSRGDIVAGVNP